jgi:predicted deacetylase
MDLLVRANEYEVDDLFSAVLRHVWLNIEHCKTTETTQGLVELIHKVYNEDSRSILHQFRFYVVQNSTYERWTKVSMIAEKLEQEIPEFATDDTRELRERLMATREALRNQGYELVLDGERVERSTSL